MRCVLLVFARPSLIQPQPAGTSLSGISLAGVLLAGLVSLGCGSDPAPLPAAGGSSDLGATADATSADDVPFGGDDATPGPGALGDAATDEQDAEPGVSDAGPAPDEGPVPTDEGSRTPDEPDVTASEDAATPSCDDGDPCTTDNAIVGEDGSITCTHPRTLNCCGDGILDPLETCEGDCPSSCNDFVPYTKDVMSGSPQTCDVVCTHEDAGWDSDGDGATDFQEALDGHPFTSPNVFNGLDATIGVAPSGTFTSAQCNLFFGNDYGDMLGLFSASNQGHPITAGWDYAAGNTPNYDDPANYGFEPPFEHHDNVGAYNSFQIWFRGSIWLPESGTWCFSVDTGAGGLGPGDIAGRRNSCGRVFLNAGPSDVWIAETGYGSNASPHTGCVTVEAGVHGFDLAARHYEAHFYGPKFQVRHCFGGEAGCTPDQFLDPAMMQAVPVSEADLEAAPEAPAP